MSRDVQSQDVDALQRVTCVAALPLYTQHGALTRNLCGRSGRDGAAWAKARGARGVRALCDVRRTGVCEGRRRRAHSNAAPFSRRASGALSFGPRVLGGLSASRAMCLSGGTRLHGLSPAAACAACAAEQNRSGLPFTIPQCACEPDRSPTPAPAVADMFSALVAKSCPPLLLTTTKSPPGFITNDAHHSALSHPAEIGTTGIHALYLGTKSTVTRPAHTPEKGRAMRYAKMSLMEK